MTSLLRAAAFGLFVLPSLLACEAEEIVVVRRGDAGGAEAGGAPCADDAACGASDFCSKGSCGDSSGKCELRPTYCDSKFEPVCGCDGLTYFNDCLRRSFGVASAVVGECGHGRECGEREGACPADAYCGKLVPPGPNCPGDARGKCWVLPAVCGEPPGDRFRRCTPPGSPAEPCVDLCSAVRAEVPHQRAFKCGP